MKWNSRQILVIVAAVVIVAAGAIFFLTRGGSSTVDLGTGGDAGNGGAPAGPSSEALMVAGPLGDMAEGDPKAPNTVIEYASMTCSHCANFHNTVYRDFKKKYIDTGKAYFIFREYPLDPLATSGAMLVRCSPADRQFAMIDLLFDQQNNWAFVKNPKEALINLVKQAGIQRSRLQRLLDESEDTGRSERGEGTRLQAVRRRRDADVLHQRRRASRRAVAGRPRQDSRRLAATRVPLRAVSPGAPPETGADG